MCIAIVTTFDTMRCSTVALLSFASIDNKSVLFENCLVCYLLYDDRTSILHHAQYLIAN